MLLQFEVNGQGYHFLRNFRFGKVGFLFQKSGPHIFKGAVTVVGHKNIAELDVGH